MDENPNNVTDEQVRENKCKRIARRITRNRLAKPLAIAGAIAVAGSIIAREWIDSPNLHPRMIGLAATLLASAAFRYLPRAYARKDKTVSLILGGIALVISAGAIAWAIFVLWLLYRADPNDPGHSVRMLHILYVGLPPIVGYAVSRLLVAFAQLWMNLIADDEDVYSEDACDE